MKYVYKIIAALISLAVIPLLIFSPLVYYRVQSTALQAVITIGQYLGSSAISDFVNENGSVPDTIADSVSLRDVYDMRSLLTTLSEGESTGETFDIIKVPLITVGVFLVMIAICAIVTAVLAIVCRDNRKAVYGSLLGIGLCVSFKYAFDSLAAPVLDGKLTSGFIASLLANVEEFDLASGFWLIPAAFVCVIVWTVLYNITLPENEKLERKRMLGE